MPAALTIVPVIGRICAEEALLRDQFGEAARRWRLVPGIY